MLSGRPVDGPKSGQGREALRTILVIFLGTLLPLLILASITLWHSRNAQLYVDNQGRKLSISEFTAIFQSSEPGVTPLDRLDTARLLRREFATGIVTFTVQPAKPRLFKVIPAVPQHVHLEVNAEGIVLRWWHTDG